MEQVDVSVIVPVYGVENFIERCARSLFEQSVLPLEYIFVDDGSPDRSISILESLVGEYGVGDRVNIVRHKFNRGLEAARNSGLDAARGRFVLYCDSDDWVETTILEKLYGTAVSQSADIAWCDIVLENPTRSVYCAESAEPDPKAAIRSMLAGGMTGSLCNKLILRSLFTRNKIHFPDHVFMWEDLLIATKLFWYADRVVRLREGLYHYVRYNPGSVTLRPSEEAIVSMMTVVDEIEMFLTQNGAADIVSNELNYKKLTIKHHRLFYCGRRERSARAAIYPEADRFIASYRKINPLSRLALWCATHRMMPAANAIYAGIPRLKALAGR